jgi:hypothetical protein
MPPANPKSLSDDAAMRKKKNAEAQAAFRARRANYIATLEEAGKSHLNILIRPNFPLITSMSPSQSRTSSL